MKKLFTPILITLRCFWKILNGISTILSILFLVILLSIIGALFIKPPVHISQDSALVIKLQGDIVEEKSVSSPFAKAVNEIIGEPISEEMLLQDILDIINEAAKDSKIKLIVLKPSKLGYAGFNQLKTIGSALRKFKHNNKMIVAVGDSFNQAQYYLASYADKIYLNPMGAVGLRGFGIYRIYAKDLLDKLAINFHLFKAGSYKSALEPFIRNDMSPEAKESNSLWLNNLWRVYRKDIADNRGLKPEKIDSFINGLPLLLEQAKGNNAQMALNEGLIDGLKTSQEVEVYLVNLVGKSEDLQDLISYKQISAEDYLSSFDHSYIRSDSQKDRVGIIIAQGEIVHGEKIPGTISDVELRAQIRQAENDKTVKALVLRIDSGGGSAFASEEIRQELLLLKEKKPVVVSMGSMAASGGYWIATSANYIIASPLTLTGSIGVFGAFPTFEDSLAKAGIYSDGVGTSEIADSNSLFRAPSEKVKRALQLGVEEGYDRFLNIVAESRNMTRSDALRRAEGRVWDGETARQLGLIDSLGTLEDSIQKAAQIAGLNDCEAVYIVPKKYTGQKVLQNLLYAFAANTQKSIIFNKGQKVVEHIEQQFDFLRLAKDPANIYAHCLIPRTFFSVQN